MSGAIVKAGGVNQAIEVSVLLRGKVLAREVGRRRCAIKVVADVPWKRSIADQEEKGGRGLWPTDKPEV